MAGAYSAIDHTESTEVVPTFLMFVLRSFRAALSAGLDDERTTDEQLAISPQTSSLLGQPVRQDCSWRNPRWLVGNHDGSVMRSTATPFGIAVPSQADYP